MSALPPPDEIGPELDPADWSAFRTVAHRMLDDVIDYVAGIRARPVWQKTPPSTERALCHPLPIRGESLEEVHAQFMQHVLPYTTGNVHPLFMGWVHGGGNVFGMLAEMVAGGLNANLGGRDQAPVRVERQVIRWFADAFGLPATASGVLVTGTSIANFIAVVTARCAALGPEVRRRGLDGRRLIAYASAAAHACVPRAMDLAGFGTDALRLVPVDAAHRIDLRCLADAVTADLAAGYRPFMVIGTAGTVDVGAFDDLTGVAEICRAHRMWFHVDGAFGALGILTDRLRPRLAGIEQADSIAFDFHKWGQVPYDAGCILVRDQAAELAAFAAGAAYLRRESRGLAADAPWPCDLGPDLSRGFRALKVWYTLKVLGAERLGAAIDRTCALAGHLAERIDREPELERAAPVSLNIVCFRYRFAADGDRQNAELVADLQERGEAAPSTTILEGRTVIRSAIVNHRTRRADVDAFVEMVLAAGRGRNQGLTG